MFLEEKRTKPYMMVEDLARLKADGVNTIAMFLFVRTPTLKSNTVDKGPDARSNATVAATVDIIHKAGLAVSLIPYVRIDQDNTWRGLLNPTDPHAWFGNYRRLLREYAALAEAHDVELFTVGTELYTLQADRFRPEWKRVVDETRSIFHGKITYETSTGGDALERMTWWDLVDYIGLSAYYSLSPKHNPPVADLIKVWKQVYFPKLRETSIKFNRKVLFGEIGYTSNSLAAYKPATIWQTNEGTYSPEAQANAYQAVLEATKGQTWYAGIQWFHWALPQGSHNRGYEPRNKPAECVLAKYWAAQTNFLKGFEDSTSRCWLAHVNVKRLGRGASVL